eukprot:TRINITY_DN905_c0_g1_i1.p1 TRINITY_DN905_c0_g1~~TRINITY_DN905_c0_g1_i1.p1  ORF type:complete len:363 (+),score=69.30 TRINITY_DN905_c0_g1_i1:98-1186(+)
MLHIGVIGAAGVGKSCMTTRFVQDKFTKGYDPTVLDYYRKHETVDGEQATVTLYDTPGMEEYSGVCNDPYKKGDGFIVVYSVDDRDSFQEVENRRNEVLLARGDDALVPMILVGNKCDLNEQRQVTKEEGERLAKTWYGNDVSIPFFETSAKDNNNIDEVFHQIIRQIRMTTSQPPASTTEVSRPVPSEPKVLMIGAGGVGKSCLSVKYVQGRFNENYDPSILDTYRKEVAFNGEFTPVIVIDVAGQEEYTQLRDCYHKKSDGFIVVYSVDDRDSFQEVEKRRNEVLLARGDDALVPMILVGNKCDLNEQRQVTKEEGERLAKTWYGNDVSIPFFETSAKDNNNIDEVFHQIIRQIQNWDGK